MKFNEPLTEHVPPPQLQTHFGGEVDFEYQHDVYWPALNQLCEERRKAYHDRWVQAGSKVGASERELRGGSAVDKITEEVEKLAV